MVAEERITTKFGGLVVAADTEEEASFLASQQVDEARHMQFYARLQDEVIAEPEAIGAHVARSRERLGDSFEVIFDQALVQAHERLLADPRDAAGKVAFVTTYHLIIESTLGLTAFEFITRYLRENERLPGLRRRLHPHPPRRAASHRVRGVVPARGRGRPGAGRSDQVDSAGVAAGDRGSPGAPGRGQRLRGTRRDRRRGPRLRPPGTHPQAEDRRRGALSLATALFVCLHNAGRSQMSQALFERAAGGRHTALSAGTTPGDAVHPEVIEVMSELGIDLSGRRPRGLTHELAEQADVVVTMGCGDECPYIPGRRYIDWDLADPKGRPVEEVRATRDEIASRVAELVSELDR